MKISVLFPGKIKPTALAPAQEVYVRRLRAFGVETIEYKDEKISSRTADEVKRMEGERLLKQLKKEDYLVVCDERGTGVGTMEMAELIRSARQGAGPLAGQGRLVVAVGGALGFADEVRQRANAVWALSSLVLAGGVARVVLLEALYRAFTVVDGHPYHNE